MTFLKLIFITFYVIWLYCASYSFYKIIEIERKILTFDVGFYSCSANYQFCLFFHFCSGIYKFWPYCGLLFSREFSSCTSFPFFFLLGTLSPIETLLWVNSSLFCFPNLGLRSFGTVPGFFGTWVFGAFQLSWSFLRGIGSFGTGVCLLPFLKFPSLGREIPFPLGLC